MRIRKFQILSYLIAAGASIANVPGGGTTGANVTVTDNGGTVTLDNGIVSIVITKARFYLALASNFATGLDVSVNGTSIGSFTPGNPSDAVVRLGSHGAFWDTQILFNSNLLKAGANTLSIGQTKSGESATLEWDYLRLEADGTGTVTDALSPRPVEHAIQRSGSSLLGDGIHGLDLVAADGRMLGHAEPGGALDLSRLSRGTYFARCAGETMPLAWSR